jgi:hypothetical protein
VIQTLFAPPERADVAVQIEDREGIAVLQHCGAVGSLRRTRQDVVLILNLDYVFHSGSHFVVWPARRCVSCW